MVHPSRPLRGHRQVRLRRNGGGPFQLQDAVTCGVVSGLSLRLGGSALAASQAGRTKEPEAHAVPGYSLSAYDWDFVAAERELKRAIQLDPLAVFPVFTREYCLYFAHRYDEAIAAHRKTEELAPGFWYPDSFLGASHRELGTSRPRCALTRRVTVSFGENRSTAWRSLTLAWAERRKHATSFGGWTTRPARPTCR